LISSCSKVSSDGTPTGLGLPFGQFLAAEPEIKRLSAVVHLTDLLGFVPLWLTRAWMILEWKILDWVILEWKTILEWERILEWRSS
jgi:hypothetical protein